ncbi:unnamed protein product [Coregonus sp. 'balchen']|nr:unnamed protein product [Coregonus sp. 'balchen']
MYILQVSSHPHSQPQPAPPVRQQQQQEQSRPRMEKVMIQKCDSSLESYCLNGECLLLLDINEHHCKCEMGYYGPRCAHLEMVFQPMREEHVILTANKNERALCLTRIKEKEVTAFDFCSRAPMKGVISGVSVEVGAEEIKMNIPGVVLA